MTPEEKAIDLISKFTYSQRKFKELARIDVAKECAKICTDKVLQTLSGGSEDAAFWLQVKQQINKV